MQRTVRRTGPAAARRRSTLSLLASILVVPGAFAVLMSWHGGGTLSERGELWIGIFFVAAVSIAVVTGLWIHEGSVPDATDSAPSARHQPSAEARVQEGGWVRVPVEPMSAGKGTRAAVPVPGGSAVSARTLASNRKNERHPPIG